MLPLPTGDSRAVLCRDGTAYRLTEDHKPHLPGERSRIEGGVVWQAIGGDMQIIYFKLLYVPKGFGTKDIWVADQHSTRAVLDVGCTSGSHGH